MLAMNLFKGIYKLVCSEEKWPAICVADGAAPANHTSECQVNGAHLPRQLQALWRGLLSSLHCCHRVSTGVAAETRQLRLPQASILVKETHLPGKVKSRPTCMDRTPPIPGCSQERSASRCIGRLCTLACTITLTVACGPSIS